MKVGQIIEYQGDYIRYGVITKVSVGERFGTVLRVWATFRDSQATAHKAYQRHLKGVEVQVTSISGLRLTSAKVIGQYACEKGRGLRHEKQYAVQA